MQSQNLIAKSNTGWIAGSFAIVNSLFNAVLQPSPNFVNFGAPLTVGPPIYPCTSQAWVISEPAADGSQTITCSMEGYEGMGLIVKDGGLYVNKGTPTPFTITSCIEGSFILEVAGTPEYSQMIRLIEYKNLTGQVTLDDKPEEYSSYWRLCPVSQVGPNE